MSTYERYNVNRVEMFLLPFLMIYVFLGDFFSAFGLIYLKYFAAFVSLFFGSFVFIESIQNEIKTIKSICIGFIALSFFYFFYWSAYNEINLFLSVYFGYLFYLYKSNFIKIVYVLLIIQAILILYEVIFNTFLYTETTLGLFQHTSFDYAKNIALLKKTGFRAKGLFSGVLVGASFLIYSAIIFRHNLKILFLLLVLSFLVNGRLSILITSIIFFLNIRKTNIKIGKREISNRLKAIIFFIFTIIVIITILINIDTKAKKNILKSFDFKSEANSGRIDRATGGIKYYYKEYNFVEKLLGNDKFVLKDQWNRDVSAESEWVNLLLNTGLLGVVVYLVIFSKLLKRSRFYDYHNKQIVKMYTVFLLMFTCMIVYRHIAGFMRGGLFWFVIFNFLAEYQKIVDENSKENKNILIA